MAYTVSAVEMHQVRKRYGKTVALDGLDLVARRGTIHGVLGPNGAGKTTALRILATLLRFDAGSARVAGFDVVRHADEVRQRIALTGQYAAVDELLSGRQNLVMFGRLLHLPAAVAKRRADELLERFDLTEVASRSAGQYSGGMRRRLDLAASLLGTPEVLFLDEPTTGLDPRGRNEIWDAVRELAGEGTTVLLTTQYLEEADRLAHDTSVVDRGRVVATGTPEQLKASIGGDRIEVTVGDGHDLPRTAEIVARAAAGRLTVDGAALTVSAPVTDRVVALTEVAAALRDTGVAAEDIAVRRPTLDEAFLHLTHRTPEVAA